MGNDCAWTQTAEWLPDHVTFVCRRSNEQVDELQWFLASVQAAKLVLHFASHSLNALGATDLRFAPNVGNANVAFELCAQLGPLASRYWCVLIHAEIRAANRGTVFIRILDQFYECFHRRVVPEMVSGQIFARCRVQYAARIVG